MRNSLWLVVLVCFLFAVNAFAAQSQQIAVTVTIAQSVSVSVSPGSYAFGSTGEGNAVATAPDAFIAANDGNGPENLTIMVSNSNNWTAGSVAGEEVFAMNYYKGGMWNLISPITGSSLASGLAPDSNVNFGLQLLVPTSTIHGGVEQSISVTVTASAS